MDEGKKQKGPQEEDFDEEEFNGEVTRCVLRILVVKKGENVGDRVIRFLGLFLKHASDKGEFIGGELWGVAAVAVLIFAI